MHLRVFLLPPSPALPAALTQSGTLLHKAALEQCRDTNCSKQAEQWNHIPRPPPSCWGHCLLETGRVISTNSLPVALGTGGWQPQSMRYSRSPQTLSYCPFFQDKAKDPASLSPWRPETHSLSTSLVPPLPALPLLAHPRHASKGNLAWHHTGCHCPCALWVNYTAYSHSRYGTDI